MGINLLEEVVTKILGGSGQGKSIRII